MYISPKMFVRETTLLLDDHQAIFASTKLCCDIKHPLIVIIQSNPDGKNQAQP